jgi:uncharacterized protein (DUF488 family)
VTPARQIWTAGHSTLSAEAFIALLQSCGIEGVADVRRFAASRRHPQFNRDALEKSLSDAGLAYLHLPDLGGRREAAVDSPNTGWREDGFRGYADHMQSVAFGLGIDALLAFAETRRTCVLCAERDWRGCHRGLVADWLKARQWLVLHIVAPGEVEPHPYTAPARIVDGNLSYALEPAAQATLDLR